MNHAIALLVLTIGCLSLFCHQRLVDMYYRGLGRAVERDFWEGKLFLCGMAFVCFGSLRLAYLLFLAP